MNGNSEKNAEYLMNNYFNCYIIQKLKQVILC